MMNSTSKESGYNIETFVVVVDAAGWSMKLATSDAFAFIKGMASTDSDHYPGKCTFRYQNTFNIFRNNLSKLLFGIVFSHHLILVLHCRTLGGGICY